MKCALSLAEDNRILSATFAKFAHAGAVLVNEIPEGDIHNYMYENGAYLYSPLPVEEVPETVTSEEILSVLLGVSE